MPVVWSTVYREIMKISTASTYDYVNLSAHVKAVLLNQYNCIKEVDALKLRKNITPEYIAEYRKAKGCFSPRKQVVDKIGNIAYYKCLCGFKHPLTPTLLTASRHYENGVMPCRGSLLDQPNKIIELLELIHGVKLEIEIEKAEKAKKVKR